MSDDPNDTLFPVLQRPLGRRKALQCLAFASAGSVFVMRGGVPKALFGSEAAAATRSGSDFVFAQISDSHIGFNKDANPDPGATLQAALDSVNKIVQPAFLLHTGDVSHLSKPEEFDTAQQLIRGAKLDTHFVPGEHDVINSDGQAFFQKFSPNAPQGWYSFDYNGAHFIGLVNVLNLKAGGLGYLGSDQLAWLERDLRGKSASTPIIVFAHMPLWSLYPSWGWGTDDSEPAMALLRRFGSVTVLNGHVHQVLQKVEGNLTFHTARSTAFPQPAAGEGPGPAPMKVDPSILRSVLGIAGVTVKVSRDQVAIEDTSLSAAASMPMQRAAIDTMFFGD